MLVLNRNKMLFIHIPKSGGTSLRSYLGLLDGDKREEGNKHSWLDTEELRCKYQHYIKFTVVRNCYRRIASYYSFLKHKNAGFERFPEDFVSFLKLRKDKLESDTEINRWMYMDQTKYILTEAGEKTVDIIIDYDNLDDEVGELLKKRNMLRPSVSMRSLNVTPAYNYMGLYTDEAVAIVNQLCETEIEYFGWKL